MEIPRSSRALLYFLLWVLLLACPCSGATATWGYVNKYASTLHAEEVFLPADGAASTDVVYGVQNDAAGDAYSITAVHAYDMTPPVIGNEGDDGDGGSALLLSGGIGQQHAVVRIERHVKAAYPTPVRFQLVVYGVQL